MRLAAVLALMIGLASARAGTLDLEAVGDTSSDGVVYTPLERPLAIRIAQVAGELRLTATVTKLFDASAYHTLGSWTTTIHVHVVVEHAGSNDPIEVHRIVRTARYDAWDERYAIEGDGTTRVVTPKAEALRVLTTLEDVPIARLAGLPAEELTVAIIAELNPVSERARAEVQGWVSGSVFGRLVSMFVEAGPDGADRVLRVRSARFRI